MKKLCEANNCRLCLADIIIMSKEYCGNRKNPLNISKLPKIFVSLFIDN